MDKKLGENASMEEKKEGEKERGRKHEIEGIKEGEKWNFEVCLTRLLSSKLQQVLHMLLFID